MSISIHALLAESDGRHRSNNGSPVHFYPRSPCGERRDVIAVMTEAQSISIHALLAESDRMFASVFCGVFLFLSTLSLRRATPKLSIKLAIKIYFYPRSPCGERLSEFWTVPSHQLFLSTLSLRRATLTKYHFTLLSYISIHALLAESDIDKVPNQGKIDKFLSTLSLRRATNIVL